MWMSKSRWGAQEKLDLMLQDLEAQTEWYDYKAKAQAAWQKKQDQAQSSSHPSQGPSAGSSSSVPSSSAGTTSRQDSKSPPNVVDLTHPVEGEVLPPPDHV